MYMYIYFYISLAQPLVKTRATLGLLLTNSWATLRLVQRKGRARVGQPLGKSRARVGNQ